MKDKLLHFLVKLLATYTWFTIGLIAVIILSPLALIAFIEDKIFNDRRYLN